MLSTARRLALGILCLALLAACASRSGERGSQTTTSSRGATSTTGVTTTAVSSTTVDLDALPPCEPDMGSTRLWQDDLPGAEDPDPGAVISAEAPFDWDQDGNPDQLLVGEPPGTVTLSWGSGQLTVTGVLTDFSQEVRDEEGKLLFVPLSPELAAEVVPAAVGDVTGDGWADLIVANSGTVAVLTGGGDETATGEIPFEDLGRATKGWRSDAEKPPNYAGPGTPIVTPIPTSLIRIATGDFTEDGVTDFLTIGIVERAGGPIAYFSGIPCTTEER